MENTIRDKLARLDMVEAQLAAAEHQAARNAFGDDRSCCVETVVAAGKTSQSRHAGGAAALRASQSVSGGTMPVPRS